MIATLNPVIETPDPPVLPTSQSPMVIYRPIIGVHHVIKSESYNAEAIALHEMIATLNPVVETPLPEYQNHLAKMLPLSNKIQIQMKFYHILYAKYGTLGSQNNG